MEMGEGFAYLFNCGRRTEDAAPRKDLRASERLMAITGSRRRQYPREQDLVIRPESSREYDIPSFRGFLTRQETCTGRENLWCWLYSQ